MYFVLAGWEQTLYLTPVLSLLRERRFSFAQKQGRGWWLACHMWDKDNHLNVSCLLLTVVFTARCMSAVCLSAGIYLIHSRLSNGLTSFSTSTSFCAAQFYHNMNKMNVLHRVWLYLYFNHCFPLPATAPGQVEELGLFGKRRSSFRRSARGHMFGKSMDSGTATKGKPLLGIVRNYVSFTRRHNKVA